MKGSASAPSIGGKEPATFRGTWKGGPHGPTCLIKIDIIGVNDLQAHYVAPSGEAGEFTGRVQHGGMSARCFWTDPDVRGGAKKNVDQTLDLRLSMDGLTWNGTAHFVDGTSVEWSAKKVVRPQRAKGRKLSTTGWYKNKDVFDRLTAPKSRSAWASRERTDVMNKSLKVSTSGPANGLLSESGPLCLGDPYSDRTGPRTLPPRKGASMLSGTSKIKAHKGCFSEPASIAVGDPYDDPGRASYRAKLQKHKATVGSFDRREFRTGQCRLLKKQPAFLLEVDGDAPKEVVAELLKSKREAAKRPTARDVKFAPKNFLTSPSKRGHGNTVPGLLLSHKSKEQLPLTQYLPGDEYGAETRIATLEKAVAIAKRGDRPPFVPRAHVADKGTFSSDKEVFEGGGPGGVAPITFRPASRPSSAPAGRRKTTATSGAAADAAEAESVASERPPYVPPYKHNPDGTFSPFPEHVPEPVEPKLLKPRFSNKEGPAPWVRPTVAKSRPVASIVRNPINIRRAMSAGRSRR